MSYFKEKITEKVTLVTDPEYWVEISADLTWADMKKVSNVGIDGNVSYQVDAMLEAALVGWNLDDSNGNILPLTLENIDKLKRADIEKIITTVGGKIEEPKEVKKAS